MQQSKYYIVSIKSLKKQLDGGTYLLSELLNDFGMRFLVDNKTMNHLLTDNFEEKDIFTSNSIFNIMLNYSMCGYLTKYSKKWYGDVMNDNLIISYDSKTKAFKVVDEFMINESFKSLMYVKYGIEIMSLSTDGSINSYINKKQEEYESIDKDRLTKIENIIGGAIGKHKSALLIVSDGTNFYNIKLEKYPDMYRYDDKITSLFKYGEGDIMTYYNNVITLFSIMSQKTSECSVTVHTGQIIDNNEVKLIYKFDKNFKNIPVETIIKDVNKDLNGQYGIVYCDMEGNMMCIEDIAN